MFSVDVRAFERKAAQLNAAADQVPFALANAMTTAAFQARDVLINETWPGAVKVRNKTLMRAALRVVKAMKSNLRVEINDERINGRAHLKLHADAGTKQAQGRLAIPPSGSAIAGRRGAKGIPKGSRPAAIVARTPPRALRITSKGIFVGEGGKLNLVYSLTPSANQPADVPFREDFARIMLREMAVAFPTAIAKAMKSRRR